MVSASKVSHSKAITYDGDRFLGQTKGIASGKRNDVRRAWKHYNKWSVQQWAFGVWRAEVIESESDCETLSLCSSDEEAPDPLPLDSDSDSEVEDLPSPVPEINNRQLAIWGNTAPLPPVEEVEPEKPVKKTTVPRRFTEGKSTLQGSPRELFYHFTSKSSQSLFYNTPYIDSA